MSTLTSSFNEEGVEEESGEEERGGGGRDGVSEEAAKLLTPRKFELWNSDKRGKSVLATCDNPDSMCWLLNSEESEEEEGDIVCVLRDSLRSGARVLFLGIEAALVRVQEVRVTERVLLR